MRTLVILCSVAAICCAKPEPGFVDDAVKLWDDIHSGIDTLQERAKEEVSRLKPWAEQVEKEMEPALSRMEDQLGHSFESLMDHLSSSPVFEFSTIDRKDNTPIVRGDNDKSGEESETPEEGQVTSQRHPLFDHPLMKHPLFGGFDDMSEPMNPFSIFGMSRRKWWDGPNVCIDKKVIDENNNEESDEQISKEEADKEEAENEADFLNHGVFVMDMSFTSCRDDTDFHECTTKTNLDGRQQTIITTKQCCYGYSRKEGEFGCTKMDLLNLEETIEDIGAMEFVALLDTTGLKDELKKNITVFAPSNEAVEDFRHDLEKINSLDTEGQVEYNIDSGLTYNRKKREITVVETPSLKEIMAGHMVEGFVDSNHIHDEDLLETLTDDRSKLRMTVYNTYPEKVVMANCAKVVSKDHYTTNGVVHVLDKVVLPATKTIAEILDSDLQFRSLNSVMKKSKLSNELNKPGQMTLFAPTDVAFDKLDDKLREKVLKGNGCSQDILKNHLLPNVICTGVIQNKAKTSNVMNKYLMLERNQEDELFIEGKKIVMRDIIASNGVIHVIDDILVPESAQSIPDALKKREMNSFNELFEIAGMEEGLESLSNMTVFAPTEKALSELPDNFISELKEDPQKLQEFLMYHVATPKTCKCEFENNKELKSGIEGKNIRINTYNSLPFSVLGPNRQVATAQCATLVNLDEEVCGGMIHTVDKVLLPPGGKIVEVIKANGKYSKFLELIEFAGLENELNTEGPYTVLVPTDDAFEILKEDTREKMFSDKDLAIEVVHHHTIHDMLCCAGIQRSYGFFDMSGRRTMAGDVLSLRRSTGGHLYADRSEISSCDTVAENGVVHALDRVLLPESLTPKDQVATRRRGTGGLDLRSILIPGSFKQFKLF